MRRGGIYLVYVHLDKTTGRIVASAKTDKFLRECLSDYKPGQAVNALVVEHTERGYKTIVNNLHKGMIYANEIFRVLSSFEESVTASLRRVREDGKIDLYT